MKHYQGIFSGRTAVVFGLPSLAVIQFGKTFRIWTLGRVRALPSKALALQLKTALITGSNFLPFFLGDPFELKPLNSFALELSD